MKNHYNLSLLMFVKRLILPILVLGFGNLLWSQNATQVPVVEPPFGDALVDQILESRPIFTIWNIKLSTDACADLVAFSSSGVANQRGILGFNDQGCLTIFNISECSFGVTPFDNLPDVNYDPNLQPDQLPPPDDDGTSY